MGIGISYRGHDGKTQHMEYDGSPESVKAFRELAGMKADAPAMSGAKFRGGAKPRFHIPALSETEMVRHPQPQVPASEDPKIKVAPGGGISEDPDGTLRLEGGMPEPGGLSFYLAKGGRRQWAGIEQIDPSTIGALVGSPAGGDSGDSESGGTNLEADTNEHGAGTKEAFSASVVSRVAVEQDNGGDGKLHVFTRNLSFTAMGRTVALGPESKNSLPFQVGAGGEKDAPLPVDSIEIGPDDEGPSTALEDTWALGDLTPLDQPAKLELKVCSRIEYDHSAASPVLYGFFRILTFDLRGRIVSVSAETRYEIDTPVTI